jgi:type IV secretory pathway VirB4 component
MRFLNKFSEFQRENPLCLELPYWEIIDDTVVLADGSLVNGYQLSGVSIETFDTDKINHITLELRTLLSSLPDSSEVSFVLDVNSDYRNLLDEHEAYSKNNPDILEITKERVEKLQALAKENILLKPNLYLFVYNRIDSIKDKKKTSFFSSPKHFQGTKKETHEKRLEALNQLSAQIISSLNSAGISSSALNSQKIVEIIYQFLNPARCKSLKAPKLNNECKTQEFTQEELEKAPSLSLPSLREQLVFSDVVSGYENLFYDGYFYKCITLKTLPEFTCSALISKFYLPFPYRLNVHIQVPEQSKELSSLQAKRRMAHSMSLSQSGRATDLESEAKLSSTEELLREIINTGQKIFYFQFSILLKAKTKEELESQEKLALTRIRELNSAEGLSETVSNFKVFKTLLPFGNTTLARPKRVKTDNLSDFLPVYQPFEGEKDTNPICLFNNREKGLIKYDPFDSKLTNYNVLVTGSSGSGKSFLNNLVLFQYLSQNPNIYIIDIGGSYKKLCEYLGGQYVEIAPPNNEEK